MASKEFEILKDKLAYFGGYKWLPYVDAVELVNENEKLQSANDKHIEVVTDYAIENQQLKDKIKGLERINHEQALKIVELKNTNKQTQDTYQSIEYKLTGEHGNDFGSYSKLEDAREYGQETADDLEIDIEINKVTTEFITILEPAREDD